MELKSSGFKRRKKSITMYSYISIRDGRKKCLNLEKNWMHASYMSIGKLRVIPLPSSKLRSMRQLDMWLWYSDIVIQRTSVYFKISRRCIKVKKKKERKRLPPRLQSFTRFIGQSLEQYKFSCKNIRDNKNRTKRNVYELFRILFRSERWIRFGLIYSYIVAVSFNLRRITLVVFVLAWNVIERGFRRPSVQTKDY